MSKMKSSLWIYHKCFKTTETHSLAVCSSLCGEKFFLLTFIPFYWFDKKQLFKQILIFLSICLIQTWYEKQNFEYFSARFGDSHMHISLKLKVLYEFPPKCFKTTERHSLAVCGSLCGEKQFLLIFIPFYWWQKKVV